MENINMTIKGTKLTIEVDLAHEGAVSKSGKSVIIATSSGNQPVPGTDAIIGLNIYKRRS